MYHISQFFFYFTSLKYDPFYVISIFHFLYSSTHISIYNHLHIQNYNKKKSLGFICYHKETFVAKYVCAFPFDTELCECCHKNYYLKTKNPKSFALPNFGITSTVYSVPSFSKGTLGNCTGHWTIICVFLNLMFNVQSLKFNQKLCLKKFS